MCGPTRTRTWDGGFGDHCFTAKLWTRSKNDTTNAYRPPVRAAGMLGAKYRDIAVDRLSTRFLKDDVLAKGGIKLG